MVDRIDKNADDKNKAFYESDNYFDLNDATIDVNIASGVQETASAVAKLAGKTLFNAGLLAGKTSLFLGKEIINNAPDLIARATEKNLKLNSHKMSDEQISKATEYIEKNKGKKLFNPQQNKENDHE